MLQRRQILTADELKLPESVVEALVIVRDELRDGKYPHRKRADTSWISVPLSSRRRQFVDPEPVYFNMTSWQAMSHHGRLCCVGGLVERYTGYSLVIDLPQSAAQLALCYPPSGSWTIPLARAQVEMYDAITPDQAADAIDNFLYQGDPHWEQILDNAATHHH